MNDSLILIFFISLQVFGHHHFPLPVIQALYHKKHRQRNRLNQFSEFSVLFLMDLIHLIHIDDHDFFINY